MLSKSDQIYMQEARARNQARKWNRSHPDPQRGMLLLESQARTLALFGEVTVKRACWPPLFNKKGRRWICPHAKLGEVFWCYEPFWWFGVDRDRRALYFYSEQQGPNKKNLKREDGRAMPLKARRFWMVCLSIELLPKRAGWLIHLKRAEIGAKSAALAALPISRGIRYPISESG